jgi:hypothetical protein
MSGSGRVSRQRLSSGMERPCATGESIEKTAAETLEEPGPELSAFFETGGPIPILTML